MKEGGQKLTRGQMVYAPITSNERTSKSPFSSNKKVTSITKNNQPYAQQKQPINKSLPQNPQWTDYSEQYQNSQERSNMLKSSPVSYHQYEEQLESLIKQNQTLKSRQQIYVSKLMKLQEGLQKQHQQFMNLQQLYTELFNGYKLKQEEISELQLRYKQTSRERSEFNSYKRQQQSLLSVQKGNSLKTSILEENFKNELAQLIFQNKRLNQTNQKLISELNYIKSKEKLADSRQTLSKKVFEQLNDWHKQADSQKQDRIKLQYQNKYFKMRNQDLEKTISELQKIISMKQNQIIKMREQKISIRRQSSEKVLNRSPPKPQIDSARSKSSNQQNRKLSKLIQNLQKQNHRLRQENLTLKQKAKQSYFAKQIHKSHDSFFSEAQNAVPLHRKLQFGMNDQKIGQNTLRSYQNQNFNSQNTNQQYFSFSRQRQERQSSDQDLPTFPMDLQIEGIIKKHRQNIKNNSEQEASTQKIQLTS